jgi:hypothetical protein
MREPNHEEAKVDDVSLLSPFFSTTSGENVYYRFSKIY